MIKHYIDASGMIHGFDTENEYSVEQMAKPEFRELTSTEVSTLVYGADERQWRNAELLRADVELNKVQDGGTGTVTAWREYRNALRDWPESPDFPNVEARPVSP